MKIDKNNPVHWVCLFLFGVNSFVAWLIRPFIRPCQKKIIVLYGHKLNGNLLALHTHLSKHAVEEFEVVLDRKSTRLNSSHVAISYAVFCLKKKKQNHQQTTLDREHSKRYK